MRHHKNKGVFLFCLFVHNLIDLNEFSIQLEVNLKEKQTRCRFID